MTARPTIPDVVERFAAYGIKTSGVWGSLHVVLDECNVSDGNVEWCIAYAERRGDAEGAELGRILLTMSKTQRGKMDRAVREFLAKKGVQLP